MSVLPYFLEQEVLGLFCLAKVLRSRGALIPFREEWTWETKNWALYGSSLLLRCYSFQTLLVDTNRDCVCPCMWGFFPLALVVKNLPANASDIRDTGLILGSGRSPGEGHGNRLQYSSLENPMDRGALWATVHRVTKSRTWLNMRTGWAPAWPICYPVSHTMSHPPRSGSQPCVWE